MTWELEVERADDAEALRLEPRIADDRSAEPSDAHDRDVPRLVEAEDVPQLPEQVRDAVAAPLLSEASEVAEVLAYLRGRRLQEFAQLLGADDFQAYLL